MLVSLIYLLISILVLGLVLWLILFVIDQLGLPEPFGRVARIVVVVVGVLILIIVLLQFLPGEFANHPLLR